MGLGDGASDGVVGQSGYKHSGDGAGFPAGTGVGDGEILQSLGQFT